MAAKITILDYTIFGRPSTHAEVFDCTSGFSIAERTFTGPFRHLRALIWARNASH